MAAIGLGLELGLGQTDRALAGLPLATFLHELDSLETLENRALAANGTGCFKCGVFGHIDILCVKFASASLQNRGRCLYTILTAMASQISVFFAFFVFCGIKRL